MAKPETSRPQALLLTRKPGVDDDKLAAALHEDMAELLQFVRLRVQQCADPAAAAKAAASHDAPSLICFSDVAGLPPDCIEGALELLEEIDVAIGPATDGGVYLLGIREELDPQAAESLLNAAAGADGLAACTGLCERLGLQARALPPWFRIGNAKDLSFAENLTRLSLLSEDGDMDFFADRLRMWFENRSKA